MLYLNEIDKMLEKAKEVTQTNGYSNMEYARFADDLVVLVDNHKRHQWLSKAIVKRLREEFQKLRVEVNEDKSRIIDLTVNESFIFLGFQFRRTKSRSGKWMALYVPDIKKRTAVIRNIGEIFRQHQSQPIQGIVAQINPILRGWVNYFRIGHATRCFCYLQQWVEGRIRRHLMRNMKRRGFGWKRWSREELYQKLGIFNDYKIRYIRAT